MIKDRISFLSYRDIQISDSLRELVELYAHMMLRDKTKERTFRDSEGEMTLTSSLRINHLGSLFGVQFDARVSNEFGNGNMVVLVDPRFTKVVLRGGYANTTLSFNIKSGGSYIRRRP